MTFSPPRRSAGRTATRTLLALGVAGTIGASVTAYSDTAVAPATDPASGAGSSARQPDSPVVDNGTGVATAPQLGPGSGRAHARSSGS